MRTLSSVLALVVLVACTGCMTRSISNSGYGYYGREPLYQGELSEFDLLGIERDKPISDEDIAAAFNKPDKLRLKRNSAVLLVQSGAMFPDDPMQAEMSRHFKVAPFSGIPQTTKDTQNSVTPSAGPGSASLSKALRMAAAQGGYDYILCYWGVLEAEQKNAGTKAVSWVPIVGKMVPDETQQMRIRLKMIMMDARTGQWAMLAPDPITDNAVSARITRQRSDQGQVATLKEQGYKALVETLFKYYVE